MKLGDILKIKSGTLIKGIRMDGEPIENRSIYMDLDGWSINGIPLQQFNESREDPTLRIAALTLIPNHVITDVRKNVMETPTLEDLTITDLAINQNVLGEVPRYAEFCPLAEGDILGMSLGENLLTFMRYSPDIYRKDSWQVVCYHKLLKGDKIWWVKMMSNPLYSSLHTNEKVRKKAAEAVMEIL